MTFPIKKNVCSSRIDRFRTCISYFRKIPHVLQMGSTYEAYISYMAQRFDASIFYYFDKYFAKIERARSSKICTFAELKDTQNIEHCSMYVYVILIQN